MKLPIYIVNAFTQKQFGGNPAGVVPLSNWLEDSLMQQIAKENDLPETAFFVRQSDHYQLRWFSPKVEVDLCGHATLASAWVISERLRPGCNAMRFQSRLHTLCVQREGAELTLDFPSLPPQQQQAPEVLEFLLGKHLKECWLAEDLIAVVENEEVVRNFAPDLKAIETLPGRALSLTAKGNEVDFVSRLFAPKIGIPEDPATGSLQCELTPLWASKLGRNELTARQLSARSGDFHCRLNQHRVLISGRAQLYLEGSIHV